MKIILKFKRAFYKETEILYEAYRFFNPNNIDRLIYKFNSTDN
jgi:hypothetical protein